MDQSAKLSPPRTAAIGVHFGRRTRNPAGTRGGSEKAGTGPQSSGADRIGSSRPFTREGAIRAADRFARLVHSRDGRVAAGHAEPFPRRCPVLPVARVFRLPNLGGRGVPHGHRSNQYGGRGALTVWQRLLTWLADLWKSFRAFLRDPPTEKKDWED